MPADWYMKSANSLHRGLIKISGSLGVGSIALMLLGTQWYVLFNVIAGAMSIPSDLREAATLYKFCLLYTSDAADE